MAFDLSDWDSDFDEEDDPFDFPIGLGPADLASDMFVGRADRLTNEGYHVNDVIYGLVLALGALNRSSAGGDHWEQTTNDFVLLARQLDKEDEFVRGDVIHAISLALADFTTQLRSDADID